MILSKIERGERLPTQDQLSNLANYYKYDVITKFTYKILDILDPDYSESLLAIFLPIYNSIEQSKMKET